MASIVGNWDDENGKIRGLLDQGRGELDMAKRVEIYQEVYDIILAENPIVFVTYGVRLPVFRSYVKDFFAYGDIRYNWWEIWLDK